MSFSSTPIANMTNRGTRMLCGALGVDCCEVIVRMRAPLLARWAAANLMLLFQADKF